MPGIRPFVPDDLQQVASLYEQVMRSGSTTPPTGLAPYFARTFLEQPWPDPDIPSLVYVGPDGAVGGFLGSSVRRLRFDGEELRMCVSGQLVVEERMRGLGAGAFLMNACLNGPQDLTITDGATPTVAAIWSRLGGEANQLACIGWTRIFRPVRFAAAFLADRRTDAATTPRAALTSLFSLATERVPGPSLRPRKLESTFAVPLTSGAMTQHLDTIAAAFRVIPAYDEHFLDWVLGELSSVSSRGSLVARLVRENGRVVGWYIYYLPARGIGQVVQIAAAPADAAPVVGDLLRDAWSRGAAGLQGRFEPHLREPLAKRRAVFHSAASLALIHSRNIDLLHAVQSGRALLTRLDGEWWMGHHLEPFLEER
jgi:hypothetical protein